jgi:hypothetical protein
MKTRIPLLLAAFSALISFEAAACGDSLYRVGKGVSYRAYFAPLPGNVLVYGVGAAGARQLANALQQSGHGVRFVENEDELSSALAESDYDVVIATYSQHKTIESLDPDYKRRYLPVAQSEAEASAARAEYDEVMVAERADLKHYLKAIHASVK